MRLRLLIFYCFESRLTRYDKAMKNHRYLSYTKLQSTVLASCVFLLMTGCATHSRLENAEKTASTNLMQNIKISSKPFVITLFNKITNSNEPATVYIEGDGLAWLGRRTPSLDPTPIHPIALELAAKDPSPNVIYMARPCQYSKLTTTQACPTKYWTSHRFAPEVINAMSNALSNIKQQNNLSEFNLVGFSGGGAVAALITAQRNDILSLRTVAGNLDHILTSKIHNVSDMQGSLNPTEVASQISNIPQHHFIGTEDKIIPFAIYKSFRKASGNTDCIRYTLVQNTSHNKGWNEKWRHLLSEPIKCQKQ